MVVDQVVKDMVLLHHGLWVPIRSTNREIKYIQTPVVEMLEARMTSRVELLRRVAQRMSMHGLAEEFTMLHLRPL